MLLLMVSLLVGSMMACSQGSLATKSGQTTRQAPMSEETFTVVEVPPSFPGGMSRFSDYLHKNLRYPEAAIKAKVEGRVFVSFIVMQDGSIQDVQVLKGYGYGTNEEATRLIQTMPNWLPGKQSGHPVNVKYNVVVPFRLDAIK